MGAARVRDPRTRSPPSNHEPQRVCVPVFAAQNRDDTQRDGAHNIRTFSFEHFRRPSMPKSREVHLTQRPTGAPTPADFALVEQDVPDAADGQVLVENLYMSVDPAMRPRLTAGQALNEAIGCGTLG